MCWSRPARGPAGASRRALSTNGATALTSWVSSSSTDDTSSSVNRHEFRSRRSTCCRSWSRRPSGNSPASCAVVGQEAELRQLGAWLRPARVGLRHERRHGLAGLQHLDGRSPPRSRRGAARTSAGMLADRRRLQVHHVAVERGRSAHGLAGVVDDVVEPRAGSRTGGAEGLDARCVAQIEPVHLERGRASRRSRAPAANRVAASQGKRVVTISWAPARSSLQARLVADLDAATGEQRGAAAAGRRSRCACAKLSSAHSGHSWS